jgi:hypothetical protein
MKKNGMAIGFWAGALMLAGLLFSASPAKAESHFSIGIGVGPGFYAPPPVVYRPPYPGPGYYWTDGYYDPYGVWVAGFWAPRAYVRPYGYGYVGRGYYGGYRRGFARDDFHGGRDWNRGRENWRRR